MRKLSVCILFGGVSPEHEVSLRSAESVLNNIDQEKYNVFPVGITRSGEWILFGGRDYSMLPSGAWETCEQNRKAALSPVRGQGLLSFENDCLELVYGQEYNKASDPAGGRSAGGLAGHPEAALEPEAGGLHG